MALGAILTFLLHLDLIAALDYDYQGPLFIEEPPNRVEFLNSTGTVINCLAHGFPSPRVKWYTKNGLEAINIRSLRQVGIDGSLIFSPFSSAQYLSDIHDTIYRCEASNNVGTIVSRDCYVKAVLDEPLKPEVHNKYVIKGNDGLLECSVQGHLRQYVTIVSWIREPNFVIEDNLRDKHLSEPNSKHLILETGELLIKSVTSSSSLDAYRCQARNILNEKTYTSISSGRIVATETLTPISPRINYISPKTVIKESSDIYLACVSQGHPKVNYYWFKDDFYLINQFNYLNAYDHNFFLIKNARIHDSGKYTCLVNNTKGMDKREVEVIVRTKIWTTLNPTQQLIRTKQSVVLNCSISGFPVNDIVWFKNGQVLSKYGQNYQMSNNIIKIRNLRREDEGMYQCLVKNDFESVQAVATLIHDDDPPRFLEVFTSKVVEIGQSFSLKCVSTGNPLPQITWTLDGFSLDARNIRIGDYVTSENYVISFVNISSLEIKNGGEYACKASSDVSSIEHHKSISVIGPPFVRSMSNFSLVSGTTLSIKCPVGGYPIKSIIWSKNDKRLPDNHRQHLHQNGTLIIKDISKEADEGYYQCTALGKDDAQSANGFYLSVKVAPLIEEFLLPSTIQIGQRLSLSCTIIQGDPPFSIEWQKDGQIIDYNQNRVSVHHLADYSSTLLFKGIKPEDRGNYTCIASNAVGQNVRTQEMIVYASPQWTHEPVDITAVKGKRIWSDCQANGFPNPSVVWKKAFNSSTGYKAIVSSFHRQTLDNGTLYIEDIAKEDAGLYLCQISNGIGTELSKVIRISVYEAAHFKSKFKSKSVYKNQDSTLTCKAYGQKPITIEWRKDNQPLSSDTQSVYVKETVSDEGLVSELEIFSVKRSDTALYTCQASNAYGKDEIRIQLKVKENPDPPIDIKISEIESRTVKVSWSHPFSGNSQILKYFIYLRQNSDLSLFNEQMRNISVPATETFWIISDLIQYTNYTLTLTAVNGIGESEPSTPKHFQTEEEAPNLAPEHIRAFATSSKTVKVTWNSPENRYSFGKIVGYYVGYRLLNSQDSYIYKTVAISSNFRPEVVLRNLKKQTKYEIVVQAYNNKGGGVLSEPVLVETYFEDPPEPPKLRSTYVTSNSINLEWREEDDTLLTGFIIYVNRLNDNSFEERIDFNQRNHLIKNLNCGTLYQISIRALSSVGKSEKSLPLDVSTNGTVPIAPLKDAFINFINSTSINLNLKAWKDGGCEIKQFSIKYKAQFEQAWTVVSNAISANQKIIMIDGLQPSTFYNLKSTASSEAGSTDAVYTFLTASLKDRDFGGLLPVAYNQEYYRFFFELEVLLPLILSLVVVIAVVILICILANKRLSYQNIYTNTQRDFTDRGSTIQKMNHYDKFATFSSFDKTRAKLISDSLINYPSPYASVQVNGTKSTPATLEKRFINNTLYATVKRTPRVPKSEHNIYDYPVASTFDPLCS